LLSIVVKRDFKKKKKKREKNRIHLKSPVTLPHRQAAIVCPQTDTQQEKKGDRKIYLKK
jgi:hypothetical protein